MTTMTTPAAPTLGRPARRVTQPALAAHPAGVCYAIVNLNGRLSVMDAPDGGAELFPLGRRTTSGTVYRVDLGDDIACWLDGDHLGHCINPVAAQLCAELSGGRFIGPDDAPFVCGPVLFVGANAVGLSDSQLRRIVDAHAVASTDEQYEPASADLAGPQAALA